MFLNNIFLKTLRDYRYALLWWGAGLFLICLWIVLLYPSVRDMHELNRLLEGAPSTLIKAFTGDISDMTSPTGYLNSQLFFFMLPLLFIIFCIGFGGYAVAGEEERGTMELLLSNPVPRRRVVIEKYAAMVLCAVILSFLTVVGIASGKNTAELNLAIGQIAAATVACALLGLFFGALALGVGCIRGSHSLSIGIASAAAVASYFLNALAPLVQYLKPYRKLSPFYYYTGGDPLANGLSPGNTMVLIVLAAALVFVSIFFLERRDLQS
ncbi:MAG: ABC transporter permease subunit [Bacillota bacterium]